MCEKVSSLNFFFYLRENFRPKPKTHYSGLNDSV